MKEKETKTYSLTTEVVNLIEMIYDEIRINKSFIIEKSVISYAASEYPEILNEWKNQINKK